MSTLVSNLPFAYHNNHRCHYLVFPTVIHPASSTTIEVKRELIEEERPKKRVSILSPEDDKLRVKKKPMTVRFHEDVKGEERSKLTSPGKSNDL